MTKKKARRHFHGRRSTESLDDFSGTLAEDHIGRIDKRAAKPRREDFNQSGFTLETVSVPPTEPNSATSTLDSEAHAEAAVEAALREYAGWGDHAPSRYDPGRFWRDRPGRGRDLGGGSGDDDDDSDSEVALELGRVVASSSSGSSTSGDGGTNSPGAAGRTRYGPGGAGRACKQVLVLGSLLAAILTGAAAMGYAAFPRGGADGGAAVANDEERGASPDALGAEEAEEDVARGEQERLERAERIVTACAEARMDEDRTECMSLCRGSACCFVKGGGEESCADDEDMDCAVRAGCEALLDGVLVEGAEEDEE